MHCGQEHCSPQGSTRALELAAASKPTSGGRLRPQAEPQPLPATCVTPDPVSTSSCASCGGVPICSPVTNTPACRRWVQGVTGCYGETPAVQRHLCPLPPPQLTVQAGVGIQRQQCGVIAYEGHKFDWENPTGARQASQQQRGQQGRQPHGRVAPHGGAGLGSRSTGVHFLGRLPGLLPAAVCEEG